MLQPTTASDIAALRAFNRAYTLRLGLLHPRLDASPFTLAEARVLYEPAHRPEPVAADLARALDLDRAQLSRTRKRFTERGLVVTTDAPEGGRRRPIALTEAGRAAFAALDRGTQEAVGTLLGSLPAAKRSRLVSAARSIARVFEPDDNPGVALRGLRPGDLGWITHRQAILYVDQQRARLGAPPLRAGRLRAGRGGAPPLLRGGPRGADLVARPAADRRAGAMIVREVDARVSHHEGPERAPPGTGRSGM